MRRTHRPLAAIRALLVFGLTGCGSDTGGNTDADQKVLSQAGFAKP